MADKSKADAAKAFRESLLKRGGATKTFRLEAEHIEALETLTKHFGKQNEAVNKALLFAAKSLDSGQLNLFDDDSESAEDRINKVQETADKNAEKIADLETEIKEMKAAAVDIASISAGFKAVINQLQANPVKSPPAKAKQQAIKQATPQAEKPAKPDDLTKNWTPARKAAFDAIPKQFTDAALSIKEKLGGSENSEEKKAALQDTYARMRMANISQQIIADLFNEASIPTVSGRGVWAKGSFAKWPQTLDLS